MKIAIFGIYPPPLGGIAVHIKRCVKLLLGKGDEVSVYNQGSYHNGKDKIYSVPLKKILPIIMFNDFDILHFHNTNRSLKFLFLLIKIFRNKIILTSHGDSLTNQLEQASYPIKWWLLINLKCVDKIICVNPKTAKTLSTFGIRNTEVVSPYINPVECKSDITEIPKSVWKFIRSAEFLISANGAIRFHSEEDLYGLDLLIDCMKMYRKSNVKLIFCVLSVEEQNNKEIKYYQSLKKLIVEHDLTDNIFLYEVHNSEFYPILKVSHLFIRPTNTDGCPISLTEAMHYNIPSLASDVCQRPEGTLIIKSRCIHSLNQQVKYVLSHYDLEKEKVSSTDVPDNFDDIYQIYTELDNK